MRAYRGTLLVRERAARERLERLLVVTAALSAAATAEDVAEVILREGRGALDAFAAVVWVRERSDLVLLHADGFTPEFVALAADLDRRAGAGRRKLAHRRPGVD